MKTKHLILSILSFGSLASYAQLTIDAEFRPRTEYRNGFKKLVGENQDPAFFTSQRTRFNVGYKTDKYTFYTSFQDIRTWGDANQLNENTSSLALHQAWAKVKLNKDIDIKLGRQEISYDDQRFMGSVGWAQQARSHDALLIKYNKNGYTADAGFAYNQESQKLIGNDYNLNKNYKTMQYLWLNKNWGDLETSVLFLNNGLQSFMNYDDTKGEIIDKQKTNFSQTIGTHIKYKVSDEIKLNANAYYQTGNDRIGSDLSAHLIGLEINYKPKESKWFAGLGFEQQSGNAYDTKPGENNAFSPLYGTNHKFNGWMDYFYVGNHNNSVGLNDLYIKAGTKLGEKSSIVLVAHNFTAHKEAFKGIDKNFGQEIDLAYTHKVSKDVTLQAGYSHLIQDKGLKFIQANNSDNTNNWAWMMLTIKPTLFKGK